ncbi:retrovirus-related pol polyprotein from transposon TNT 1-94 [Tanacetum coccineum]
MTKRHSKEAKTTRTEKVIGSALDAEIQIILSENVQNHRRTRTKEHLLEVLGLIAVRKMMKRLKTKHVSWLKHLASKCKVIFSKTDSEIVKDGKVIGRCIRKRGLYVMKLGKKPEDKICLATIDENSTLWHRRLGHANMRLIQSLASKELVTNLPKLKFDQHLCDACKIGKQAHTSHKAENLVSTTRCLELLHMDLFGPSAIRSYGGNLYTLVIVGDYSRKPTLDYFKVFRSKCFILNTKDYLTKFDPKSYEDEEKAIKVTKKKNLENDIEDETLEVDKIVNIKESKNHPFENIIGNLNQRTLRSQA